MNMRKTGSQIENWWDHVMINNIKDVLRAEKALGQKCHEFLASVFSAEDVGKIL